MSHNKRALALWLGLFFYFYLSPQAQEISSGTGTLWVDGGGASFYWHSGIALNINPGESPPRFSLGFNLGQVLSNLPIANGSVFGFMGQFGIEMPRGGVNLAFGFFSQPPSNAAMDKIVLSGGAGRGYFFSLETPLRLGRLSIVPSLLYGSAAWEEGDFYWFFGKPDISSLLGYGLDIFLAGSAGSRRRHGLGFHGVSADMNIVSGEDISLFASQLNAGLLFYQFSLEGAKTAFSGTAGWLYANASLNGELNSSNQPYFLFPYSYFNVDAHYKAHAGFTMLRFRYSPGIFRYSINLGALHIFYDQGEADTHYKLKKLFNAEESSDKYNPEITGLGAAFLTLEAAVRALPAGSRCRFSLELQKAFALPWGYKKLFPSGSAGSISGTESSSMLKTVLLSGLSIRGSLSW
jgi:hypothetical protein